MSKFFRKINLPFENFTECTEMISCIENFVYSIYPLAQSSSVWCVSENNISFALFYNNNSHELETTEMTEITWEILRENIPNFDNFFKKYYLENTFAKGFDQVYYPHRHTYPKTSRWSLTFLQKNAENSYVKFFETKNSHLYSDTEHQIRNDDEVELIDEILVDNGDVCSVNTWQWHNWIPNHEKSEYAVFALKDTYTFDEMNVIGNLYEQVFSKDKFTRADER